MKQSKPQQKRVALGMSGGVDSSLCAHLLVEQGYDVTGVYMECWRAPGCRTEEDRKDALSIALSLDLPFKVLDFKQAYRDSVVEYFFKEYEAGLTPNPDILCNREIKFGLFYDWAMQEGFDAIATGHYAKNINNQLVIPKDIHKDQTYFLYTIREEQLKHTVFPLGDILKKDVRQQAKKRGIAVADKKDSVGICFIGDINVHAFLKERLGENPGTVIDTAGNVIGKHTGLWFYTVGQRSGFSVDHSTILTNDKGEKITKHNIPPFYVIEKKPESNQLVVGFGTETLKRIFTVRNVHWISGSEPTEQLLSNLLIRIRHTGELMEGTLTTANNQVVLKEPTKGIAAGQSAVFYNQKNTNTICLGGGIIT